MKYYLALIIIIGSPLASLAQGLGPKNPQFSVVGRMPDVSNNQASQGIKEALFNGVESAIRQLGHDGGFLTNLNVRIPLPRQLQPVEATLRALKQDQLADQLISAMNHAAEQAVPQAASVFANAISNMTISDAESILTGPQDSATQYFRRATETNLFERFLPTIKKVTDATGVTSTYKRVVQTANGNKYLGPLLEAVSGSQSFDLDTYVTDKAMEGLFKEIAAEEQRIRADPVARTSELLRQVFGAISRGQPPARVRRSWAEIMFCNRQVSDTAPRKHFSAPAECNSALRHRVTCCCVNPNRFALEPAFA